MRVEARPQAVKRSCGAEEHLRVQRWRQSQPQHREGLGAAVSLTCDHWPVGLMGACAAQGTAPKESHSDTVSLYKAVPSSEEGSQRQSP